MNSFQIVADSAVASWPLRLLFSTGVLVSGAASLINEVVWQRALQRFVGGSETLSSMLVVAAFMLGLGAGAVAGGRYAGSLGRPLAALGWLEAAMMTATLLIAAGFSGGQVGAIVDLQLKAVSLGLPVTVVFGCLAAIVLTLPCSLMGVTTPIASEALRREFRENNNRTLGMLFASNTLGAAAGALVAGYYMIPLLGISRSLYGAVALNAVAAVVFATACLGVSRQRAAGHIPPAEPPPEAPSPAVTIWPSALTMLVLGFCSLGYEMALLRLFALKRGPLPHTFTLVITGFLVTWSLGAALSSRVRRPAVARLTGLCAVTFVLPVGAYYLWWFSAGFGIPSGAIETIYRLLRRILTAGCFLPCGLFGLLFGTVVARATRIWGRDVGSLYGANTAGALAGIIAIPMAGFEVRFAVMAGALASLMALLQLFESRLAGGHPDRCAPVHGTRRIHLVIAVSSIGAAIAAAWAAGIHLEQGMSLSFSRAGVLGLDRAGNLYWDGLWHSRLARGEDYVGSNNWNLAVLPVVSYSGPGIRDVCVIGLGSGITAAVIARLESIGRIDVYEINRGLEQFHRRHPGGTLRALDNPKIKIHWQDARTGLRIRDDRYDLIITQPLYLSQAGSTFLNSREFLRIVRERLKPGGVFGIYSRGTAEQQLILRETASSVFKHGESFLN